MSDDNHSTIRPAIENFFARFERELHEIRELLLRIAVPANRDQTFKEIEEKIDLIYRGLDVFLDQEKNTLTWAEKAEIQLFQRGVLNLQLSLRTKKLSELLALLEGLHQQLVLILG